MSIMEIAHHSQSTSTHQPDSGAKETPFAKAYITLTRQEHVRLKWGSRYWQRQHARAIAQIAELKKQQQAYEAKIRDLTQRLYGKHSEKGSAPSEAQASETKPKKPRGQVQGSKGHGRTPRPRLPVIEESRDLPPDEQSCPHCNEAFDPFPGTEDSEIIEISVKAYVRKIKRVRYKKRCKCPGVPGLITAPPAPRLIPKSSLGVSIWVEVLLGKFLRCIPTNRLCADLKSLGAPIAMGTLTGGLKMMSPLFKPLIAAFLDKHLTEKQFNGDETTWKVFEEIAGKIGYRWYLWMTRSASVIYYWMAPGRGADVIKKHMAGLNLETQVIFVCDRYVAYKCWAKDDPMILLAFCWAHVRRDFLDSARAWPDLAEWMHTWVEDIGLLYHLNAQRLEVWDKSLPMASQSPIFQARHLALTDSLTALATKRDVVLAEPKLHSIKKKVLSSLDNHWSGLTVFLDHPAIPMDNNSAETSLRNPVTGRKNYYGSGTVWSANFAAMLFSILQTVILWGLNPRHWLHAYLTACAENGSLPPTDLTPFLPWAMDEARRRELAQPLILDFPEQSHPDTS
ncbi:MAG: IS66 family transposase [Candidatus Methylumidiphilus sp.]